MGIIETIDGGYRGINFAPMALFDWGYRGIEKEKGIYIFIVQVLKIFQELKPKRHSICLTRFFSNFRTFFFTFTPSQLTIEVMKLLTKVVEGVLSKLS